MKHAILATALAAFSTLTAHASLFTWGAATTISGDSDVSTAGTLVGAVNLGSGSVPNAIVNGVTFTGLGATFGADVSLGNFTLGASGNLFGTNFAGAPAGLSSGYQTMLASQTFTFLNSDAVLTITGLVSGEDYLFQWWVNSSNLSGRTTVATSEGQSISLNSRISSDRGQFATATFTADASGTQVITFGGFHEINAFQLRNVTPEPEGVPAAVPEPGTALAGVMLAGLLGVRRRRR